MPESAIVDTSVLIALEKIGLLEILCMIYDEIVLPEAVVREYGDPTIKCCCVRKVESPLIMLLANELNLGKGESAAIALAYQTGLRIVIDDRKARKVAQTLNLRVTGTVGVLLRAQQSGFLQSAYSKARELRERGFYISDEILNTLATKESSA